MFGAGEGILAEQQMLAGRNVVGGPSTRGAVWGSTQAASPGSLLTHSRSGEDLPCCPVENIKEAFMSHFGWKSLSQGNVCAQSCTFASLSPKSWRAAAYSCGGRSSLRLLAGWQIAFEKRICQFSSLLAIESSLLKWCSRGLASHSQSWCSPVLPQVL